MKTYQVQLGPKTYVVTRARTERAAKRHVEAKYKCKARACVVVEE